MELRIANIQEKILHKSLEYDRLFKASQLSTWFEQEVQIAKSNKLLKEIEDLRQEIKSLVVTVVFWIDIDGKRDIFRYEDEEKPWIKVYQICDISKERFEWILTHPDYEEAVNRYFPNI